MKYSTYLWTIFTYHISERLIAWIMWLSVFLRSLVARFGIHTTAQLLVRV